MTELVMDTAGLSADKRWFTDVWAEGVLFSFAVDRVLVDEHSAFQRVQIFDTPRLGRVLVLDDHLQTSERDEQGYHELIVHPGLCREGAPEKPRVLIIGGGDGGAARECLRHHDVIRVDLVDIDGAVMDTAREYLPSVWRHPAGGKLDDDPRLHVHAEDGVAFLADHQRGCPAYDHIVVDASDPVGPGAALYQDSFYASLVARLSSAGSISVQAGSAHYLPEVTQTVLHGLRRHLPRVDVYECFTELYPGGVWHLVMGTRGADPSHVDAARADRLGGLRFYDTQTHAAAFVLAPHVREILRADPPSLEALQKHIESLT